MDLTDTIVAPITAPGGAVAAVRLSGPRSWSVASQVFAPWPETVVARSALFGRFRHGDDGLALPFAEGASYTGEQSVELSTHGSPASVRALLEACLQAGARTAEPGEFTYRAFMNGRIDLTQAEAVRDTVAALTEAQLKLANRQREGGLLEQVEAARSPIVRVLAMVEASTDFSEEVGEVDRGLAAALCGDAEEQIRAMLETQKRGRHVREGFTIALVGPPNAGKSSLFNAVLRRSRAIVSPHAGTTRDTLEELVEIDGLLCRFVDTAGLRETADEVETEGVRRSIQAMEEADQVWYVWDATLPWPGEEQLPRADLYVANKCDLARSDFGENVSALTGEGVDALLTHVPKGLGAGGLAPIAARHAAPLQQAREALARAQETFASGLPTDPASVDLRAALRHLGEVTGETATPDILERVFADFCIGK
ncbi:MAG: tRNA uridine-5-carboxymethylaminomethyl(34) synthesis GTPase MnmE [Fimbriimonadaceae bacterium]|nr:tRNA uridine-5-carboxymethylaminomethyl(34) synthesis GTPase MnmE [Fimbriimonadaceae bacterium]QYK54979.1 MAG: tRNA uridine-5-carboxymethylaminomethyl(34) synthesis GTPase MnmE [Fimbriimonadaceae bacterium]